MKMYCHAHKHIGDPKVADAIRNVLRARRELFTSEGTPTRRGRWRR